MLLHVSIAYRLSSSGSRHCRLVKSRVEIVFHYYERCGSISCIGVYVVSSTGRYVDSTYLPVHVTLARNSQAESLCLQNTQIWKKKKLLVMGREKRSILQDSIKCDRQRDVTNLIVTFRNFKNAPKKMGSHKISSCINKI